MKTLLFVLVLASLPHVLVAEGPGTSELVGTSWKLVKIADSDDTAVQPDDPTKYTFAFLDETHVAARIDFKSPRNAADGDHS